VENGSRRVVHQVAAVDERNDFHAPRQDAIVQLLDLGVESAQGGFRVRAFTHGHPRRNDIVVV